MLTTLGLRPTFRWAYLAGLLGLMTCSAVELQSLLVTPQNWDRLLSLPGSATLALYLALLLAGLIAMSLSWFKPDALDQAPAWMARARVLRWAIATGMLLCIAWFYLYSPWQGVWPGPWAQLLFALGMATCVAWLLQLGRHLWTDGAELAYGFAIFLYPLIAMELRSWYKAPIVYRSGTVAGYLLLLGLAAWLYSAWGRQAVARLAAGRERLGKWRWAFGALLVAAPLIYLLIAGPLFYIINPAMRFAWFLLAACGLSFLMSRQADGQLQLRAVVVSSFALALVSFVANGLLTVLNYPFSLSWSEGNRFYDYSLIFGQNLYDHSGTITNPYGSPGRYILWGGLFLWQGLPIWVHRLWNLLLYTVPPLLVGWLVARRLRDVFLRVGVTLFIGLLFTVESPLHPPFLLGAALALLFMYDSSLLRKSIALAVASFYMGASRWTWIPVTAAWAILADLLLHYPARQGSLLKRLAPAFVLAVVALVPGLISGYNDLPLSSGAREYHQPLLWYRLLPNPTFPLGVLFSTILITGPAVCLLIWWIGSGRWKLDWVQVVAIAGALAGFLAAGLIVSTKIGGGADLHNLDMYLMTLTLVMVLGIASMSQRGKLVLGAWPAWAQLLLIFALLYPLYEFTPFWSGAATNPRLELAKPQEVAQTLGDIQNAVSGAGQTGDVLFMDQRQLLTFGYIHDVPFVPDYEKKYMMDQAMAGNSEYFQAYYQDLAKGRFKLIVTEVLHTRQEHSADFSEENNAWVKWVSEPTLCYYQPLSVNKDVNIELLVPKAQPVGCDVYLHGGE